ncbi:MAG TPA: PEP-CTERM sorting domain-containing protein, partial [Gemmataceae bacterium]|nr:PEP-CTERM sorting domain-containing protein [Gemmataceae bacterium]
SINNALLNVIVGSSTTAGGALHAAAWNWSGATPNPTAIDLNGLLQSNPTGMTLIEAFGINDSGLIVGYGIVGGAEHAFVLTPTAVPEPGTLALCGLGLGGLAVRTWRRRRS